MDDLWPQDLDTVDAKAPVTILKEQGMYLANRTKGIVVGNVKPVKSVPGIPGAMPFLYAFLIQSDALGGYRFELFRVGHKVSMYPVFIQLDTDILSQFPPERREGGEVRSDNELQFLDDLRIIFASQQTKQVIHALLAQAGTSPTAA
jgi:hypothetical protein